MIPMTRYVNITSGVGGGNSVRLRDYILRLFTNTELVPPQSFLEFTDPTSVGAYFGTTSPEYLRAAWYFSFISKRITKPNKISFARWCDVAVAPKVFGNTALKALATFAAVANGALALDLGSGPQTVAGINLTAAASLTAVAAALQTAIRAVAGGGTAWTAATVTYDATTNRFNLVSGQAAGAAPMAVNVAAGTDLAPLLGWTATSGAIINAGSGIETLTTMLGASAEQSNNFGSFDFVPDLTIAQRVEAATWNKTQNNMFLYSARTNVADAAALSAALINTGGVALTLSPVAGEYPAMLPAAILAATDYTLRNAAQSYMYQQAPGLTPSVLKSVDADLYDNLRVNYYGRTQSAGQLIDFYQRGEMMGLATDPTDINVYANEIWMKDSAGSAIMSLQLSLNKIPANDTGRAAIVTALQDVATRGVFNGAISVGKALNTTQKLYVTQVTGDERAWLQLQNLGYWLACVMQSYVTTDGRTEWKAVYTFLYSKDDTVRKVDGSHILI